MITKTFDPEKFVLVPVEPPEKMWYVQRDKTTVVCARDLIAWIEGIPTQQGDLLYKHLNSLRRTWPAWLEEYIPNVHHVPPKGAMACAVYRLMVETCKGDENNAENETNQG